MSTPPSGPSGSTRPAARYGNAAAGLPGPTKRSGIIGKIVTIIFIAMVIGIVFFLGKLVTERESSPAEVSIVSYERIDDETMRLWVDISREDVTQPSYCIVTALNYSMAEVGRREVIMPAGGEEQMRMEVDIPTRDYPVSGGVYGCSTTIAPYMNTEDPSYVAR